MLQRLFYECDGQDLVEYGLLVAVVVVGAAVALTTFKDAITDVWTTISNNLAGGS
jgi:Flp pilus assembly pilin Flp